MVRCRNSRLLGGALGGGAAVIVVVASLAPHAFTGAAGAFELVIDASETSGPFEVRCPEGAIPEGEPGGHGECDADTPEINPGCNVNPPVFTDVFCGETVCGVAWADGGTRDIDTYQLLATDDLMYIEVTTVAEFEVFTTTWVSDPCKDFPIQFAIASPGEPAILTQVSDGPTWWFVAYNGFDSLPCGVGAPFGNDYVVEFACSADIPPRPCPPLGDVDEDGFVDFDDLLRVIANFGECP